MLFAAVLIGVAIVPFVAFVGLPLAAAGIAGLAYRGHTMLAALAAAVGVAVVGVLGASDALYAAPVLAAVVLSVVLLPRRSFQAVAASLIGVLALANIAADEMLARSQGTTLPVAIGVETKAIAAEMVKASGNALPAETLDTLNQAVALMASAWPSAYFQTAVIVGVLIVAAISWAARKADRPIGVPSLHQLDLSPHVLWVFVAGVFLVAASYGSFAGSAIMGVVGLNLVLCARTLLFLQGISVAAGMLHRTDVGLGGRILLLAVLAAIDAFTLVVSFTGLLDFWVNFRRMPRDGVTSADVEPDGRRW